MKHLFMLLCVLMGFVTAYDDIEEAVQAGDLNYIRSEIDQKIYIITSAYLEGILLDAAKYGQLEIMQYITHFTDGLPAGLRADLVVDLNAVNFYGTSALMMAAQNGHAHIVKFLVNKGASLRLKDSKGSTLLMYGCEGGIEVVRQLLGYRLEINVQRADGATALHFAVADNNPDIVSELCRHGIDVNAHSSLTPPAIVYATNSGYWDIVEILLNHGADIESKDTDGTTVLMYASTAGQAGLVEKLISQGVGVNITDSNGNSAVHYAAYSGHWGVVEILLNHGADIKIKGSDGLTLLMYAAARGGLDMVKFLVLHDADLNAHCESGKTARDYAIQFGHSEIAEFLNSANRSDLPPILETEGYKKLRETRLKDPSHAPSFTLVDIEGAQFSSTEIYSTKGKAGRPIIIHFMATWANPAREQSAFLNKLSKDFADLKIVTICFFSDDIHFGRQTMEQTIEQLYDYVPESGMNHHMLIDNKGQVQNRFSSFSAVPLLYIIDSDGLILYEDFGFTDVESYKKERVISQIWGDD